MELNFPILLLAAVIPMFTGFVWYHPKVFGNAWMHSAGLTEEQLKGANMLKIFGLTFILSLLFAFILQTMVIHQWHFLSLLADEPGFDEPGSPVTAKVSEFMGMYGTRYRTFGHGSFHGVIIGIMFILPIIAINGLFERKSAKYIFINAGYWILTTALMGGVICAWS